jgi:hypothetical protein
MRRFGKGVPPVRKFVREAYQPEEIEREGGMVLIVSSIRWKSKSKVEVFGYTSSGLRTGLNWRYDLKLQGKKWVVIDVAHFG